MKREEEECRRQLIHDHSNQSLADLVIDLERNLDKQMEELNRLRVLLQKRGRDAGAANGRRRDK